MVSSRPSLPHFSEEWFSPLGLRLKLVSNHERIPQVARSAFGATVKAPTVLTPDVVLELEVHDEDESSRLSPTYDVGPDLLRQRLSPHSWVEVKRRGGQARGRISRQVLAHPALLRCEFLELPLYAALPHLGFVGFHGAALARDGKAILLRGRGGAGKTTLAYAAARAGFAAMADDVVWFETATETLWGMPRWFHLTPDSRARFPELASRNPVEVRGKSKITVEMSRLGGAEVTSSARPAAVVFLRRVVRERSQLVAVDRKKAWESWREGAAGDEVRSPGYAEAVHKLLRRPTFLLDLGTDLGQTLDLLTPLLA